MRILSFYSILSTQYVLKYQDLRLKHIYTKPEHSRLMHLNVGILEPLILTIIVLILYKS
jgi:hypothetical protein